jgi:CO/xanthine dehydrogenase Mo-binding subunit
MGQGAYTSQVQVLSEELEVDPTTVSISAAPPNEALYASPLFGGQLTGGSGSLRGTWLSMRTAAAAAREMLVASAAQRWNVAIAEVRAENGMLVHSPSQRTLSYGDVVDAAAGMQVPGNPVLKSPDEFRVVGQPMKRVDTPEKVNGTAKFGLDSRPDGIKYAIVSACPVFGGTLAHVDPQPALDIPYVQQVVQINNAVAVVADHTWAALKGTRALNITWNEGANSAINTEDLVRGADAALEREGLIAVDQGDIAAAEQSAASHYEADFRMPVLAHAAMEPLSCTVALTDESCEIWLGSQILGRAHQVATETSGLPPEKVILHNLYLGGGFGRRLEVDYVAQAVEIAKHVQGPVKVTWSREEDMRHDYYRYLNHSRVKVGLDANGRPVSWRHRVVAPNIMERWLPVYQKDGVDLDAVDAASGPYDIANVLIEFSRNEAPQGLNTGNWRGVGPTRNVFVVESVIDALAVNSGQDPIAYRKSMMTQFPRPLAALEIVEELSGWNEPLPENQGRGVAVFTAFGSHIALVAEVSLQANRSIRVNRVVCAVDTGLVVNPDVVKAQIEGGIIFGISAALFGEITIKNGRVEQGNFDTYPVLRMAEAPRIEVHIIKSSADPGGVGEPGTSGAIAAVANAVSAVSGQRILKLPIKLEV